MVIGVADNILETGSNLLIRNATPITIFTYL